LFQIIFTHEKSILIPELVLNTTVMGYLSFPFFPASSEPRLRSISVSQSEAGKDPALKVSDEEHLRRQGIDELGK